MLFIPLDDSQMSMYRVASFIQQHCPPDDNKISCFVVVHREDDLSANDTYIMHNIDLEELVNAIQNNINHASKPLLYFDDVVEKAWVLDLGLNRKTIYCVLIGKDLNASASFDHKVLHRIKAIF